VDSIVLSGTLVKGPLGAGDCAFPAGTTTIPFSSYPIQKNAAASFSAAKQVDSPSAFAALDGVGTSETVTQGNFLFLRTTSPFQLRLTTKADSGPDVVAVIPVQGLAIIEFPTGNYLLLLEAKGSGTIEYVVSGNL